MWGGGGGSLGAPSPHGGRLSSEVKELWDTATRWFARAVLEGVAVKGMGAWVHLLAAPPSSITKRSPSKRVLLLLGALASANKGQALSSTPGGGAVVSRRDLAAVWRLSPGYLFSEIRAWIREGDVSRFSSAWPSIVDEFLRDNLR